MIQKAMRIIEEGDFADSRERELSVASLGAITSQLWEKAQHATIYHQQILAGVDNACVLMCRGLEPSPERLSAVREALIDLSLDRLTQSNVESVNSRLMDVGFSPFAEIDEIAEDQ